MSPERWRQVKDVLDRLEGVAADRRTQAVAEACGNDTALVREVTALLAHDDQVGDFIEDPLWVFQPPAPPASAAAKDAAAGRRVGPYRLERLLGRGGMGEVYLAVREDFYRQRVALKMVGLGALPGEVRDRFYNERQILANLEHPGIARLLDGGTSAWGQPYLVMEYVEGERVDRYCAQRRLPVPAILALFRQICEVVHFAHQNLVVHRDLKPSNILVTPQGEPKLLDFGIAKLLGAAAEGQRHLTRPGGAPMTPTYASPEQLRGDAITTASDVYALGVLLFRLVGGAPPWPRAVSAGDLLREIERGEVPRPSAAARQHGRRLDGDVDAIVTKAMRSEPQRRYASALQLAEDIGNHLDGLPVLAHQGSWRYRAGKLVRRYKLGLAALLVVLGFAVTATVLWRRAEHQRALAEHERQRADDQRASAEREQLRAERVSTFLEGLYAAADPDAAQGREMTLRQALDHGRGQLRTSLEDEPEVRAELLATLGRVYNNLGWYDQARQLKEEVVAIRRPAGATPALAADLNNLARLHYDVGAYAAAEATFREAQAMWRRLGDRAELATTSINLASTLTQQGRFEAALAAHGEACDIRRRLYGDHAPQVAACAYGLGALYLARGDPRQAAPLLRRALAAYTEAYGADHTRVASVLGSLGRALHTLGLHAEAGTCYRRALDIRRRLLGDDHLATANSRRNLAALLLDQGRVDDAGALLEHALAALRRARPAGDWMIAAAEGVWGSYQAARGDHAAAERTLRASLGTLRAAKGDHHLATRDARDRLIALYRAWGRPEEAAAYLAAASAPRTAEAPPG